MECPLQNEVNNQIYHDLGERWYQASDDPVALLRAEGRTKNPWVIAQIKKAFSGVPSENIEVLDVGCGAGFLTNELSVSGFKVTGADLSESSLEVAKKYDATKRVIYQAADAYALPFGNQSFSVVTCMDFLEHVESPEKVVAEIARVLKPGGLFIFHTFNRNWLSGLIIIKGVEWFVKNTPKNMHILRLFVKPSELKAYCQKYKIQVTEMVGIAPKVNRAFFTLLRTKEVPANFQFQINRSTLLGYLGSARKQDR